MPQHWGLSFVSEIALFRFDTTINKKKKKTIKKLNQNLCISENLNKCIHKYMNTKVSLSPARRS